MDNNQTEIMENQKLTRNERIVTANIIANIVMMLFGAIAIYAFLSSVQSKTSIIKQQENNSLALTEVVSILDKNTENSDSLTDIFHQGNWKTMDDIELLFKKGLFEKMMANENIVRAEMFTELSSPAGISNLFLLDENGNVVVASDEELFGRNLATTAFVTQDNLNRMLKMSHNSEPVLVKNIYGTYYYYAMPYSYGDQQYILAMGTSSWTLDERIDSLKDVSAILSRMAVINDGFLFAVNRSDDLFMYYKNGDVLLTGQNAYNTGLNQDIMTDGYRGVQTILGEKYYCTSKAFGDDTVIVAAARSKTMGSRDKYVLLWSVMGFIIVMTLCLLYAVFVRNDFIRNNLKPEKIMLSSDPEKPLYFNKSVFKKVMPLMMIGIIVVYAITFYTQTLLEITEGIDKSNVILQEVTGRYEESVESREVIEDYYNSRFISTAKLLSFFVEESPEVLNTGSEFYHSIYDDKGNRQFLIDDEGNRLKSVANSAILQQLCDENRIEAIYIFDEDGHTIATNTGNWFFTLSQNPDDQSYPFRRVLEGKTDSYLQTAMTDDLGVNSQYFGISMHYYTTKAANGETVYVSRYAYEEACAREGVSNVTKAGNITRHRSLLQIALDSELVSSIMADTNADVILSTEMLSGGSMIMFDNTPEHTCVYSPVKASIGKAAAELGVSSKAFSGDVYYGFNRINGVSYFQVFRFVDKYFIATALPQTSMYTSRGSISLITAGVCLFMIALLLLSVTITSTVNDEVYDLISDVKGDDNLNSSIFSIILPSGRFASTTMAQIRWNNQRIPWNERSPEMKLVSILGWIIAIPVLCFVLSAVGISRSSNDSIVNFILSRGWDRSPNLFALSAAIMVILMTLIAIELFRIPVRLCTSLLGTRGETIGHLLLSIVKYGGTIGALFYCLYLFGVDSPNLLASAGILSLVIGLGAQSLIKDIIAGIFIVFEGEFRVGDIVTINGFRGTVTDIGLRTTKISGGGNVKIFNNSEISGVLNMTKETSVASATIGLEYGQDIDIVEEVLNRELPLLKEDNGQILDGPTSLGVSELAERRYTVTVIARCSEKDVRGINRYLNKSLLQIFQRNGIKIANQPVASVKPVAANQIPAETKK